MKKFVSVLLALALTLGLCGAMAESEALPAYTWSGEDPVWAAVIAYMQEKDTGIEAEEGGVLIPTPVIVKIDKNEAETEATVYGNFWLFAYAKNGNILDMTACGENPGVIKLEKKDDKWTVVSAEFAGDGEAYIEDIKRFCNGDEELIQEYLRTTGAVEDSYLPQYQRAAVIQYVEDNKLAIEAYQEPGAEPVPVND